MKENDSLLLVEGPFIVSRIVYAYYFPFVKQQFLWAQYKNHTLSSLTCVISILSTFESMMPAAFENNRDLLVQIRVMVKETSVFWKKAWALDNVTSLLCLLYLEYKHLNWPTINHK